MKRRILINNFPGLIGDTLGILPALQELCKRDYIVYIVEPESLEILKLTEEFHNKQINVYSLETINNLIQEGYFDTVYHLKLDQIFGTAVKNNWYMSQSFMNFFSLGVNNVIPKAKLNYNKESLVEPVDIIFSPFARSLPDSQKWSKENWNKLAEILSSYTIAIIGNSKYDSKDFIERDNIINFFDRSFEDVLNLYDKTKVIVSVVTGTSHLAFHNNTKNILLTNQGTKGWGINPEAICITTNISDLTVEEVYKTIIKELGNDRRGNK